MRASDTHTVWAAPLALRCFLHVRVQTNHVISSGAGVTQDDLAALLAHLAVILVVRLIAVTVLRLYSQITCQERGEKNYIQSPGT